MRFASDGSFYRLLPRAVVLADGVGEIRQLFAYSRRAGIPLTFRAAGTSLCGQAQGDGILVEVKRYWQGVQVEDRGGRVRVKPGTIAARVNLELRRYGTTIGPDPASINACTIGGVLADNSSGMCCGVEHNAYHMVESLTFVLPSGTVVDTAAPGAERRFAELEPHLVEGLRGLQRAVRADARLAARIRGKYQMKNTTGYGLNAFLDFDSPLEVFTHLLVGSEGRWRSSPKRCCGRYPTSRTGLPACCCFPICTRRALRSSRSAMRAPARSSCSTGPRCARCRTSPACQRPSPPSPTAQPGCSWSSAPATRAALPACSGSPPTPSRRCA